MTMDAFLLDKLAEINLKMNHKSKMLKSKYVEQIKNLAKKKDSWNIEKSSGKKNYLLWWYYKYFVSKLK